MGKYSLGITKFLVNDLGLVPAKQFVVDDTPKTYRDRVADVLYAKKLDFRHRSNLKKSYICI